MRTSLALVHHANQYLITTGYENREGIEAIVGSDGQNSGFLHILRVHQRLGIAFNLHISGTLLEAIAWHVPEFLDEVRGLLADGLIELVGSSYGQNIMRFFGSEYNRRQLNEELLLYRIHLGVDPSAVKVFWPPERVWDTRRLAPVLRDGRLLNDGYRFVILDDRLFLRPDDPFTTRRQYDENGGWDPELFRMHEIEDGMGLIAFPIATRLRRSIPPGERDDWRQVRSELEALLVHAADQNDFELLAMYADDMEKVAGVGEWGTAGPERYEAFLKWVSQNASWLQPVKLTEWASRTSVSNTRRIERGTFRELAVEFDAGEAYERWYLAPDWAPYRGYFSWAESKVKEAVRQGGAPCLLELADKQLLVANWETAWHTPSTGPHGDPSTNGHASPWARALTSHSRLAAVTAEAAVWKKVRDGGCHAELRDIDNDGEIELVLRNDSLFAVVTPKWGGRVVSLFSLAGARGAMVVGNPCDDWNWMEELNRYMDVPRNHPGAFADVGLEHAEYPAEIVQNSPDCAIVRLSGESGVRKQFEIRAHSGFLHVKYALPRRMPRISTEFALSPDYLEILRCGSSCLEAFDHGAVRGFRNGTVSVSVRLHGAGWERPWQERCGHACMLRAGSSERSFQIDIGAEPIQGAADSA
jgi:hypothetical protein